ncbi:hypothetical protein ES703_20958 [subsurface metagenome]
MMSIFYKINRRVNYAYQIIILIIIKIVSLHITLIKYRQHPQYNECIKQTELIKIVKEYATQKGVRWTTW